jgi:uncharacterized membrane protein
MLHFLNQLLYPLQHCEEAVKQLLKKLRLKITDTTLRKDLQEHPDYPSLASIMDVFRNYGIRNEAYKIKRQNLSDVPLPFIAHIKADKLPFNLFAPVFKVDTDSFELYNPETHRVEKWDNNRLDRCYQGVILAVDADGVEGERDYYKKSTKEKSRLIFGIVAVFLLPLMTLLACLLSIFYKPDASIVAPTFFILLILLGCFVTATLLWYEIDEHNPALNQICQPGKKVNCSRVLSSKAANIFKISWSSLGFTYFLGSLVTMMITGMYYKSVLGVLSWVNVLTLPYLIFSIYYQWHVLKQWCLLCLVVQGLLLLQFIVAFAGGFHDLLFIDEMPFDSFFAVFFTYIFVFLITQILMHLLKESKVNGQKALNLQRLKHNRQIFETLLSRGRVIDRSTAGLGITLGNPNAKYQLVKVCNPYCGPCSNAHPIVGDLLYSNYDLQVQIIFTAHGNKDDIMTPPVQHLLAIAKRGDELLIRKSLDDWYLPQKKDYNAFAEKYPNIGMLEDQNEKIRSMRAWCDAVDISFTPTFFLNGRQLPDLYEIKDLRYLLDA